MSVTTIIGSGQRSSMLSQNWTAQMPTSRPSSPLDKFPTIDEEDHDSSNETSVHLSTKAKYVPSRLWQPRRAPSISRGFGVGAKHRPRKSISETLGTMRTRSVSANAQEIAEALKAPVSYKLIALCLIWYTTSALTNTSSKSILNALPMPITLTFAQFGFVSFWCLLLAHLASVFPALKTAVPALKNGIRSPSVRVVSTALPLAFFSLGGHILSSMATSKIPVSLVHTIKGLSPLFTVLAYRVLFRIRYARATYLSLVPLTVGVMLACSTGFSTNFLGIFYAFLATVVFVSQNIFSKKLFNEAARAEAEGQSGGSVKLDKLNLLCYCSAIAFILTAPIWFLSEGYPLILDFLHNGSITLSQKKGALDHGELAGEFIFNGISHFAQNILAFVLLSMISPVSYSVASLIKRVFVIVVAIIWFGNSTTPIQAFGICLTFIGLYLYDRNSHDDMANRRANADHFHHRESILPMNSKRPWDSNGYVFPTSGPTDRSTSIPLQPTDNSKKEDGEVKRPARRSSAARHQWLPPGTKQESTWQPGDSQPQK
ncbi:hypothetical protein VTO42DRAFT_4656 [Malbranchea cinnamomea]